jgi:hypothetical protein
MEEENNIDRNWFKKHSETITVIIALLSGFLWMDSKIERVETRLSALERDVVVIKSFLYVKNILPSEFCKAEKHDSKEHPM